MKSEKHFYRIIDANINRAQEGLRVCEDILRFIANKPKTQRKLKRIRHFFQATIGEWENLFRNRMLSRNIKEDCGKKTFNFETKRLDIKSIIFANLQRVKEALRVLEEFAKICFFDNKLKTSNNFKKMRFEIYDLEKEIYNTTSDLCYCRHSKFGKKKSR